MLISSASIIQLTLFTCITLFFKKKKITQIAKPAHYFFAKKNKIKGTHARTHTHTHALIPGVWIIRTEEWPCIKTKCTYQHQCSVYNLRYSWQSCSSLLFLYFLFAMKRLLLFAVASSFLNSVLCAVGKTPLLLEKNLLCQSKEVKRTHIHSHNYELS